MIEITKNIIIPDGELLFTFSRSSGPGGQNVNKVSSRVTLRFDVANSPSLADQQKKQILSKLKTRINKKGILRIICQKYRTQNANRVEVVKRFKILMQNTLRRTPPRKKTNIPKAVIKRRIEDKKRKSRLKQERSEKMSWDE